MIPTLSQADNDVSWGSGSGIQQFNIKPRAEFKLLDRTKVIHAGCFLPQTERGRVGLEGERGCLKTEKYSIKKKNQIQPLGMAVSCRRDVFSS